MVFFWLFVIIVTIVAVVLIRVGVLGLLWLVGVVAIWVFLIGLTIGEITGHSGRIRLAPRTVTVATTDTVTNTTTQTDTVTLPTRTVVRRAPTRTVERIVTERVQTPETITVNSSEDGGSGAGTFHTSQPSGGSATPTSGDSCQYLDGNNDVQTGTQDANGNCIPTG